MLAQTDFSGRLAAPIRLSTASAPRLSARYAPAAGRAPAMLALHGIARQAPQIFDAFAAPCARAGRALLVPRFGRVAWPVFQRITRATRPDLAVLDLIETARREHGMAPGPVDLFGYSGGAQLAHRLAMLYPERFDALHLGAAGWYTMPTEALAYPLGLGPGRRGCDAISGCMRSGLAAFLDRPIAIYVGAADTDAGNTALRRTHAIDTAQGLHRRARAERYAEALAAAQSAAGLPVTVSLTVLPDCGHDFTACARDGALAERVAQAGAHASSPTAEIHGKDTP